MNELTLLLALAFAQAGDIHRCADADGGVRFSDVPCGRNVQTLDTTSDQAVRDWLEGMREPEPVIDSGPSPRVRRAMALDAAAARSGNTPSRTNPAPRRRLALNGLDPLPVGDRALAACSAIFFQCTNGDDRAMDRCIARAPVCTSNAGACCRPAYLQRYGVLRESGANRSTAVKVALLGER